MVFSNLAPPDKEAFFSLLDEYFASRPELVRALNDNASGSGNAPAPRPAASTAHNFASSIAQSYNTTPAWKQQARGAGSSPSPEGQPPELPPSLGRVAAAAAAFRNNSSPQGSPPVPRPPARGYEATEAEHEDAQPAVHGRTPSNTERLTSQKKFGDVDLSSTKSMYLSIRHGSANKNATPPPVAPPVAPALPPPRNNFGPPPVRRVPSTSPRSHNTLKTASPPPPPPPRPRVEEPQMEGDWAEALYEYSSEDPGDLELQPGQQILIVERSSDDWWTGEFQGRRGLVPAAYVKLL